MNLPEILFDTHVFEIENWREAVDSGRVKLKLDKGTGLFIVEDSLASITIPRKRIFLTKELSQESFKALKRSTKYVIQRKNMPEIVKFFRKAILSPTHPHYNDILDALKCNLIEATLSKESELKASRLRIENVRSYSGSTFQSVIGGNYVEPTRPEDYDTQESSWERLRMDYSPF